MAMVMVKGQIGADADGLGRRNTRVRVKVSFHDFCGGGGGVSSSVRRSFGKVLCDR